MSAFLEVSAIDVRKGDILLDAHHALFGVVVGVRTWPDQCRIESVTAREINFNEFDASDFVSVLRVRS